MKNKFSLRLFEFLILLYVLWGGYAWFTWWLRLSQTGAYFMHSLGLIIAIVYQTQHHIKFEFTTRNILAILFLFAADFCSVHYSGTGILTSPIHFVFKFYPLLVLLCDSKHGADILRFVCKSTAILLVPSILFYIVMALLPVIPGATIDLQDADDSYTFYNYFFLLRSTFHDSFRFQAFFLEPSYLAAVCLFLLYSQRFELKKRENLILFVALLLSASLTGYVVGLLGYLLMRIVNKKSVIGLFGIAIVLFGLYIFAINYNHGNNPLNTYIVERLQPDEELGIAGNNRTTIQTAFYFDYMWSTGQLWMGVGSEGLKEMDKRIAGDGFMLFFMQFGIVSSVLYFLFYWFAGVSGTSGYKRRHMVSFFLIILIFFIPTAHLKEYNWLIPFVLAKHLA